MLRALFKFEEASSSILAKDQLGRVGPLSVESTLNQPFIQDGYVGRCRYFDGGEGLTGSDAVSGATLLQRDVSVQALVQLDLVNQEGIPGTIVCRGRDGSAAEYYPFGLEVRVIDGAAQIAELRWYWQTSAGVLKTQLGGHFRLKVPLTGGWVLLTATRRWVSSSEVELRYYAGDQLLAEVISSDGDIGGGTTGKLSVGARRTAGVWGQHLVGGIDELAIYDHPLTAEEVEHTWRRISEHQPAGYELVQDLVPPGAPIARDPSSRIQKLLRFIGEGLGFASARAEHLRSYTLPDRAYGSGLEAWERICRVAVGARDSVEVRRRRVIAHLRRQGFSVESIRDALRELLDLHPSQVDILNFSNTYTDTFASIRAERWWAEPAASWTVTGGAARVQAALAADIRWTGDVRSAPVMLMPIQSDDGAYFAAKVTPTALPSDGEAGLVVCNWARGDYLFLGLRNNAGAYQVVGQRFRGGVAVDAVPVVYAMASNTAHWFRITKMSTAAGELEHALWWSTDGADFASAGGVSWIADYEWIGFYARGADASLAGALDVRFSEFLARTPRGTRPFRWYAYRDLALPGSPDMNGAQALLRRFRHAYTAAAAITSRSLKCDDTASGCDAGPMGAI